MTVRICLTESDINHAKKLAQQTLDRFKHVQGHYTNSPNSHLRGKLGEIACARWLDSNGLTPDPAFKEVSRLKEADLTVGTAGASHRMDVKTWHEKHWPDLGRCVAAGQLGTLRDKADSVIWCKTPSKIEPGMEVEIEGWNTLDDIAEAPRRPTGPAGRRQVDNYQVDPEMVRPPETLIERCKSASASL